MIEISLLYGGITCGAILFTIILLFVCIRQRNKDALKNNENKVRNELNFKIKKVNNKLELAEAENRLLKEKPLYGESAPNKVQDYWRTLSNISHPDWKGGRLISDESGSLGAEVKDFKDILGMLTFGQMPNNVSSHVKSLNEKWAMKEDKLSDNFQPIGISKDFKDLDQSIKSILGMLTFGQMPDNVSSHVKSLEKKAYVPKPHELSEKYEEHRSYFRSSNSNIKEGTKVRVNDSSEYQNFLHGKVGIVTATPALNARHSGMYYIRFEEVTGSFWLRQSQFDVIEETKGEFVVEGQDENGLLEKETDPIVVLCEGELDVLKLGTEVRINDSSNCFLHGKTGVTTHGCGELYYVLLKGSHGGFWIRRSQLVPQSRTEKEIDDTKIW